MRIEQLKHHQRVCEALFLLSVLSRDVPVEHTLPETGSVWDGVFICSLVASFYMFKNVRPPFFKVTCKRCNPSSPAVGP